MRRQIILWCMFAVLTLSGCANFQTISRTTTIPKTNDSDSSNVATAIHLDAQQRLVLSNSMNRICAEPSPDALAAYAASLGLGVGTPAQESGSLAQALQSSSGSIGLRTQSITLMRDTLYRMCEAWMNKAIGEVQVATLLGRSLDLTAVILAVEQLTGAVAANQVVLTGTSGAGASASILSNQDLLDSAREDETQKTEALETAKQELEEATTAVTSKQAEVDAAQQAHVAATQPGSNTTPEQVASLKHDLDTKTAELNALTNMQKSSEQNVQIKKELLAESTKNRQAIENIKDSALTNAIANTTGAGQFSVPVQKKELSKEATQAISTAVQAMVTTVLNKSYTEEACVTILSSDLIIDKNARSRIQSVCTDVIVSKLKAEQARVQAEDRRIRQEFQLE